MDANNFALFRLLRKALHFSNDESEKINEAIKKGRE